MTRILNFFIFLALAGAITPAHAQPTEGQSLPRAGDRAGTSPYVRFPDWQNIVIVQNDTINDVYYPLVLQQGWDHDVVLSDMKLVQLREFDVVPTEARVEGDNVIVPFAISLQYQDDGLLGAVMQGTMDVIGDIQLTIVSGEVTRVLVREYRDSQQSEKIGRDLGLLKKFDGKFAEGIVVPVLTHYLNSSNNAGVLLELVTASGIVIP